MINLSRFNPKYYLSGAIVVGFFEIIDGLSGLNGYSGNFSRAFSVLEVCWFVTSMFFFLVFKKQNLVVLVPAMYVLYSFYGWMVGSYLISIKSSGEMMVLPVWYMISATLFGLIYFVVSLRTYSQWYMKNGI